MVFSSTIFLFFFLPAVLLIYYLLRRRGHRNVFLTLVSLFFYAWGEPWFALVMMLSIMVNWLCGLHVDASHPQRERKTWVTLSVALNLLLLGAFKYLMFLMNNLNWAFGLHMPVPQIALPIGISFFTFQAMSYVIDVYRGDGAAQKSLLNVCLYVSFFPQLIAGPIVRYQTIADQIDGRVENLADFTEGARRFIVGLAKKVVLANNLALMVDHAYKLPGNGLSVGVAWMAAIFFHVQVFFDFSGYSDMAIGLGKMFGFHFLENFDYPMISRSITEFWRRWHISLGTWFRDYLFFPLGGSRVKSKWRLAFNMFVVWSLTGLWHGADWCFLAWGVAFFALLIAERLTGYGKWMEKHWIGHVYTNAAVVIVTVLLGSAMHTNLSTALPFEAITKATQRIGAMFGIGAASLWDATASMYAREYGVFMALAVICSLPVGKFIEHRFKLPAPVMQVGRAAGLLIAFVVTISYVVMGSYNPFIYFNF